MYIVIASAVGAAAGGVAASVLSHEQFAWSGIALVPLFILIEAVLKHVVPAFGGDQNAARLSLVGAIVACFYAAWFMVRST